MARVVPGGWIAETMSVGERQREHSGTSFAKTRGINSAQEQWRGHGARESLAGDDRRVADPAFAGY